jgi:hypothetical protein
MNGGKTANEALPHYYQRVPAARALSYCMGGAGHLCVRRPQLHRGLRFTWRRLKQSHLRGAYFLGSALANSTYNTPDLLDWWISDGKTVITPALGWFGPIAGMDMIRTGGSAQIVAWFFVSSISGAVFPQIGSQWVSGSSGAYDWYIGPTNFDTAYYWGAPVGVWELQGGGGEVPEPGTLSFLLGGVAALWLMRRRVAAR